MDYELLGRVCAWVGGIWVAGLLAYLALNIWWKIYTTVIGLPRLLKFVKAGKRALEKGGE